MTEAERAKTIAASTEQAEVKRSISRSKLLRTEKEKRLALVPKGTIDEDRVVYWLWGEMNPSYTRYLSKFKILEYFERNPEVMAAFGFHPREYKRVILSMITERHAMVNFDEFDVILVLAGSSE